jgi:hypothetical protein
MTDDMTDIEREEWNERAAILEFDAGYSRPLAERMAKRMMITARCMDAEAAQRSSRK